MKDFQHQTNHEKKYRKSRLRDLSESVSANLSLSVSPCVQSASKCPLMPRNCFSFISRDPGPSVAQKIRVFNAPVLERETSLSRGKGGYAAAKGATSRLSKSGIQVRCSVGLHAAVKHYARGSCILEAPLLHFFMLLCFGSFILLFSFLFYSNIDMSYKTL